MIPHNRRQYKNLFFWRAIDDRPYTLSILARPFPKSSESLTTKLTVSLPGSAKTQVFAKRGSANFEPVPKFTSRCFDIREAPKLAFYGYGLRHISTGKRKNASFCGKPARVFKYFGKRQNVCLPHFYFPQRKTLPVDYTIVRAAKSSNSIHKNKAARRIYSSSGGAAFPQNDGIFALISTTAAVTGCKNRN